MDKSLELTLFGSPEVRRHGQAVTGFRSSKAQALLYYLAVTGRAHTRPTLAGLLWGDQPEAAARVSLSKCLSNLRDLVGDAVLVERQTVAFNRAYPYQLDTERFAIGVVAPPTLETVHSLQTALALYRGDFLEGFYVRDAPDFEQWLLVQRAHYREAAVNRLYTLANFYDQQGDLAQAIAHNRRLLALEPWREEAHGQLMTRLACNGQRSAAMAQYVVCCQVLNEELGVEPDRELVTLYEQIRDDLVWPGKVTRLTEVKANLTLTTPHAVTLSERVFSVPASATPLIGRARELVELIDLLTNPACRLITLFGAGGIGKTRLALAAAQATTASFKQGAAFVELAGVTSAQFLPNTILTALEVELKSTQTAHQQLLTWLRNRHLLLVLDNYEQLLPDITLLLAILQSAPGVTLLVTSHERLQLQAEWLLTLTGLPYPIRNSDGDYFQAQGEAIASGSEQAYPALELFLQRVRQLQQHFVPNPAERAAIIDICRLTEGNPLALELAATAVHVHPCAVIAAGLAQGQPLTNLPMRDRPARQHTIDATFEHSWRLLTAQEQQTFRQLAVFRGGFEQEAAQYVARATLPLLAALLDKSLVHERQISAQCRRYTLHELVRQYALKKLQTADEALATSRRHACYFLTLAETAAHQVHGPEQKYWLKRLQGEQDNLRAALTNLSQEDGQSALQLAAALGPFWRRWGQDSEGREWLALIRQQSQPAWPGYATALMWEGSLARRQCKRAEALALLQESYHLFQAQCDQDGVAQSLRHLGWAYYSVDAQRSIQYFAESLAIFRALQNRQRIAQVLVDLSQLIGELTNNYPLATGYLQESLSLSQEIGDLYTRALALLQLADLYELQEQYDQAAPLYAEAIAIYQTLDLQPVLGAALFALAENCWHRRQYAEARHYAEQSCSLQYRVGGRPVIALHHWALAEYSLGDLEMAKKHFRQALQLNYSDNRTRMIARCLAGLGAVANQQQDWQRAAQLLGAANTIFATLPPFLAPIDQRWFEQQVQTTQTQGDEAVFALHWSTGSTIPLAQGVAYALTD